MNVIDRFRIAEIDQKKISSNVKEYSAETNYYHLPFEYVRFWYDFCSTVFITFSSRSSEIEMRER